MAKIKKEKQAAEKQAEVEYAEPKENVLVAVVAATEAKLSDPEPLRFADLPLISTLKSKKEMDRAKELLEELDSTSARRKTFEDREEEIKKDLEEMQRAAGLKGLRYGQLAFAVVPQPGRRTLDREMLLENGVTAVQISASYKTGKSFVKREFRNLDR